MNNHLDNPLKKSWAGHKCVILPHISPDGDAIGSTMAMYLHLKKQTDDVWLVLDDDIPKNLLFLKPEVICLEEFLSMAIHPDVVFCMDSSDRLRFGDRDVLVEQSKLTINIDHHKTNLMYGDVNIVDEKSSSTGELLFELLHDAGHDVDVDMATCIYTAMSTDTGSFKYSNTTYKTMWVASELMKKGIDLEYINVCLYQDDPKDKYYTLQAAMDNAIWEDDGRLVITAVTLDDVSKYHMDDMETEGVVEFFRNFHGVEVVMLLKEKEQNVFKVSLRSKYKYDVSELALKIGGGGHMRAAGGMVYGELKTCIDELLGLYK